MLLLTMVETGDLSLKDRIPEIWVLQTPSLKHQIGVKLVKVGDPVVITLRQQLVAVGARLKMSRKNLRATVGVLRIPQNQHLPVQVNF